MVLGEFDASTMEMSPSNFSQSSLARVFSISRDDHTHASWGTAYKRTAFMAGTVCGVAGLEILVILNITFQLTNTLFNKPQEKESIFSLVNAHKYIRLFILGTSKLKVHDS